MQKKPPGLREEYDYSLIAVSKLNAETYRDIIGKLT
jgi:hypothetical protein